MTLRGFSATFQSMRRSGRGWISTPSLSYKFQTYKKSHSKILENEPRYPSDKKNKFLTSLPGHFFGNRACNLNIHC